MAEHNAGLLPLKILHKFEILQKKQHWLQDSSCNTCSLPRGCAIHTHSPPAHILAKPDHCSPRGYSPSQPLQVWNPAFWSAQLRWPQLTHLPRYLLENTCPGDADHHSSSQSRSAVLPAVKASFYNCKFLNFAF